MRWLWLLSLCGEVACQRTPPPVPVSLPTPTASSQHASDAIYAELPTPSASPWENTQPTATYVGSRVCAECHAEQQQSHQQTGMGRSAAEVDPQREPPAGWVKHPSSPRWYDVVVKQGQWWHREWVLLPEHRELDPPSAEHSLLLAEYPVAYAVGSGRHARSYLIEIDGFLVESPLTWYAQTQRWGMSPGYQSPHQPGFERAVGLGCVICHVGQADALQGSVHRLQMVELTISCERCHGPGSLHVAKHQGEVAPLGDEPSPPVGEHMPRDRSIVNPATLPRELAEAVCQQCHLRGHAAIQTRYRALFDYRPGLPLTAFVHHYRLDTTESPWTVTGHAEQLHLSRCYQRSSQLTCLSCHDPHHERQGEEGRQYVLSVCRQCHRPEDCSQRSKMGAAEHASECLSCHMPRARTEIPHLSFTHHRVGIHPPYPATPPMAEALPPVISELVPILPLEGRPERERRRSYALALLEVGNRHPTAAGAAHYHQQAEQLLLALYAQGERDPAVLAGLARLAYQRGDSRALSWAEELLGQAAAVGHERVLGLYIAAEFALLQRQPHRAAPWLQELVRLRRHAFDWALLAQYQTQMNEPFHLSLERSLQINPRQPALRQTLIRWYRSQGNTHAAARHERLLFLE
ncbi:MAG: hypothetical protein KatS3mg114_0297 [Planctomycetaceae bacterium]|nr:MAG: hypothetical protein KatS3mg114_0297 [Planctomycetaceae bacterium]